MYYIQIDILLIKFLDFKEQLKPKTTMESIHDSPRCSHSRYKNGIQT